MERAEKITRVEKPWGYELHWAKTAKSVGNIIHVNAGHALSLQYHNIKDETIMVWAGKIKLEKKKMNIINGKEKLRIFKIV